MARFKYLFLFKWYMFLRAIPRQNVNISHKEIKAFIKTLFSGKLLKGEKIEKFEALFRRYIGVKHAVSVGSARVALYLLLKALDVKEGDEIILPAYNYFIVPDIVLCVGAKPVFVDIDKDTYNIDVSKIESAITSRTKAIIPVHEFGLAAEISQIVDIAKKHNLFVIEDAAEALGAIENDQFVGGFGDFGSFSFHPRKAITSGEGGLLTINDEALANGIRILRNHGISYSEGKMDFVQAGFNYRMTDIQAVLVNTQFDDLDLMLKFKQQLAEVYMNEIHNAQVTLPYIPDNKNHTWQTFHLISENNKKRDELMNHMKENGIMTNYGAQCIPHMTYYFHKYKHNSTIEFPNAYKAYSCGLAIPIYNLLTKEQIKYISKSINNFK